MKVKEYLSDRLVFFLMQIILLGAIEVIISMLTKEHSVMIFVAVLFTLFDGGYLIYDYLRRQNFYGTVEEQLEHMDEKTYLSQLIECPSFKEGELFYDTLKICTKSMNDTMAKDKRNQQEYEDYIETWIHEVKLPISSIGLLCENNRNEVTKVIMEENQKIDGFVEQALYYARSNHVEQDYAIQNVDLAQVVNDTLKKYSRTLIYCKTHISQENLDVKVYTDPKWLGFMLGQVIGNSVKYRKDDLELSFVAKEEEHHVKLYVKDNGIGIANEDLGRIFQKGFTGQQGRKYAKSTGIGLYLCRRLCEKMHLSIQAESEIEKGCTIIFSFPKNKLIFFEEE